MTYPLSRDDPKLVDVVCDDVVLLTLQYSTQWDSLAHVGQQFDVDGDGKPEMVFYNGYRAGEHIDRAGRLSRRQGGRDRRPCRRGAARHREHGARLRAGPRRDDRPACAFRPRAQNGRLRRPDGGAGEGQGRRWSRATSSACAPASTRCCSNSTASRTNSIHRRLRGARRPRRAAAAMGDRLPALVALISDNYAVEGVPGAAVRRTPITAPRCRCTRTACSGSASISARSGT